MDLVATRIKLSLSGIFGKSGRYYEFSGPLELVVEQIDADCWMYRIDALNLWAAEPGRSECAGSFAQLFDEHYDNYGLLDPETATEGARQVQAHLLELIKKVY
ncbi:hypothetical protein KDL44_11535 [bacterium]|nr:hypothetical protein [bacterium]